MKFLSKYLRIKNLSESTRFEEARALLNSEFLKDSSEDYSLEFLGNEFEGHAVVNANDLLEEITKIKDSGATHVDFWNGENGFTIFGYSVNPCTEEEAEFIRERKRKQVANRVSRLEALIASFERQIHDLKKTLNE